MIGALQRAPLARGLPLPAARRLEAPARALCTEAKPKPEEAKPADADPAEEAAAEEQPAEDARMGELEARVVELEDELKQKHDALLRALAEAENARRRAAIDVENANKFAVGKFAKSLLDVADNLGRAADSVPEELRTSDENLPLKSLYEGVVLTDSVLHKTFEKYGLHRMAPLGQKFDPNIHDALFEMPDPEKEAGTVAHVTSAGYMLHERCLRAAGVGIVSKPPS